MHANKEATAFCSTSFVLKRYNSLPLPQAAAARVHSARATLVCYQNHPSVIEGERAASKRRVSHTKQ